MGEQQGKKKDRQAVKLTRIVAAATGVGVRSDAG
jgi:hypothetical protein